jgi:methylase of polypeptide subunit release factors
VWQDAALARRDLWLSPGAPLPARAGPAGDETRAAAALARARAGEALVHGGDFHNARQLLAAMGRRLGAGHRPVRGSPAERYRAERRRVVEAAEVLSRLVVPVEPGWEIPLRRAPEVAEACAEALGPPLDRRGLLPLRDLLGMIGAHEWRRRGVEVAALGARVHPHYGVYAPVRAEPVDLVARAAEAWPVAGKRALDLGTGTGVLALVLARRGARVVASDVEPAAVACARENAARLGLAERVEVVEADLFPAGVFDLVVSNPPWIPGAAHGPLDRAIFDPDGRVLERLVLGVRERLAPGGEAWIVLSDLAEILGLRPAGTVLALAARAGLAVVDTLRAAPSHPRARDTSDPLHPFRARETTILYRLAER